METTNAELLVNGELVHKSLHYSAMAYRMGEQFYYDSEEETLWISFPGTAVLEDVVVDSDYGLSPLWEGLQAPAHWGCNPSVDLFSKCLAHRGFTRRFAEIWRAEKLANLIGTSVEDQKQNVIFTGHSLGGAIAALATLWLLYLSRTATGLRVHKLRFACVTFGMPFVGDVKLSELAQIQGWDGHFVHVVCRHDIVPRMLLAPLKSISKSLHALLPFWSSNAANNAAGAKHSEPAISTATAGTTEPAVQEASISFVKAVVKACAQVAGVVYTGCSNTLLRSFCKMSPYRPFGAYLFCSTSGASLINKPVTVLQMLHLTLQEKDHGVSSKPAAYILEHTLWHYMQILQSLPDIMEKRGGEFAQMAVEESQSVFELEIALQLHTLGLDVKDLQSKLVLLQDRKTKEIMEANAASRHCEFVKVLHAMAKLEWFKKQCEKKMQHYYDVFKLYDEEIALEANLNRMVVTSFWDETIEMYSNGLLPPTFKAQNKWVNSGHAFRLLVEPLDIANYYRLGKGEDTGKGYLSVRPNRYKVLEEWYRDKQIRRGPSTERSSSPSLTQDSVLFAKVEENGVMELRAEQNKDLAKDIKFSLWWPTRKE